jgi:carboxylate-amine ligase
VIEHAFGKSPASSVGVEEELFVVDAETLEPAPFPSDGFDGDRVKPELFTTLVELSTGICLSAADAAGELAGLRAQVRRLAAGAGLSVAASGTWPLARSAEQPVTADDGYRRFVDYAGPTARRQYCTGLHVHVGVESPERCLAALEAVLPWLPVILAVSASSPYLDARETGMASIRAELLGLLPRSGAPPVFGSYAEWEQFAERLLALGIVDSYRRLWWDVRPHPLFGTLEVRIADQPTRLETTAALVALLQALVTAAREGPAADRGLYAQNRWAASRFGRAAGLVHPDGSRLASAGDLLAELLELVVPTCDRLGTTALLAPLETLDQAEEQLAVGRAEGLATLCRRLVALT